jgi:hypothetical protein
MSHFMKSTVALRLYIALNIALLVVRQETTTDTAEWKITLLTLVCCLNSMARWDFSFLHHAFNTSVYTPTDFPEAVKHFARSCTTWQTCLRDVKSPINYVTKLLPGDICAGVLVRSCKIKPFTMATFETN